MGDKVICLNNNGYRSCLTLGKVYDIDNGSLVIAWRSRFISLSEHREKKLDKLLV